MQTNLAKKPERDVFYWLLYLGAALVAGYHTFHVFRMSDEDWISAVAALVVDGVVAYTAQKIGDWTGNQKKAGLLGILMFGLISGISQLIMRFQGSGAVIPEILRIASLALVPLASTGTVLVLAAIKYFGVSKTEERAPGKVEVTMKADSSEAIHAISDVAKQLNDIKPQALLPASVPMKRRGRPPKVAYAKDIADPKLKDGS